MIMNFLRDESGASLVDYSLIMALISLAIIGAVTLLEEQLQTTFNSDSSAMSGVAAR
jgi:pilus assembly protein Flp/PilA